MKPSSARAEELFWGPGEMRRLCREKDWTATPLGSPEGWPVSLRTMVATMLASRHPMFLFWGPQLIQFYNDAYRPSLGAGRRHPAALGMRGAECWTEIWHIIGPQIEQVMQRGEATWHEDHLVPIERNGRIEEVYWTYGYSPAFDDEGEIAGVLVVCQETTGKVRADRTLRQERARLLQTLRQAPALVALLSGPGHVIEFANDAYLELVGRKDIIGKPLLEALPEMRGQGFEDLLEHVLATGEAYVGRGVPVSIHKGGGPLSQIYVDFVYQPIIEDDGSRSGVLALGTDVTDSVLRRREKEAMLSDAETARSTAEAAQVKAEDANRSKSEFLAMMSHELRTPLNAIQGHAELIELGVYGEVNEKQREALTRIRRSQRHLLSLVSGLLSYAKLDSGSLTFELADLILADLVKDCHEIVLPEAQAKGITLEREDASDGAVVRVDGDKTRQAILNLLGNAIKFTQTGGRIVLRSSRKGNTAIVEVIDSGVGVPVGQLERIFEPFVQLDSGLVRAHGGVGLGLAISRDLIRGMGGDISVRSEVGRGSTFTLSLQLADQR